MTTRKVDRYEVTFEDHDRRVARSEQRSRQAGLTVQSCSSAPGTVSAFQPNRAPAHFPSQGLPVR